MRNPNHPQSLTEIDRQTFHDLYQKHHRRVYSICFRMTQSVPESEHLLCEEASEENPHSLRGYIV